MNDTEKAALIAEIEEARRKIASAGAALRDASESVRRTLDLPSRAKRSFEKHRLAWLGGSALLGVLLAKLPARTKTVFVEQATGVAGKLGTIWGIAKFATGIAQPFLAELATKWLASRTRKRE